MSILPYIIIGLCGLVAGGITNIAAQRFPKTDVPLFSPLHCTQSGEPLTFLDVIPVLGYALQKGKCRHCGKTLPWRFPAIEIGMAAFFMLAWPLYEEEPVYIYAINVFYIFLLGTIGAIDWRYRLIFPVMTWGGVVIALIVGITTGAHEDSALPDGLGSVIIGAIVGGAFFYFIYLVAYLMYRRRALGFGDVLLAIMIGAIIGFPRVVTSLFLGTIMGGFVAIGFFIFARRRRHDFIPYGTTLCLGVIFILTWGYAIWAWGPFGTITWLLQGIFQNIYNFLNP